MRALITEQDPLHLSIEVKKKLVKTEENKIDKDKLKPQVKMDCEDIEDLLLNPNVQYREMKEVLIKKCRAINAKEAEDPESSDNSWNVIIELLCYFRKTEKFAESHTELHDTITVDNIDIVRYLMWTMPYK